MILLSIRRVPLNTAYFLWSLAVLVLIVGSLGCGKVPQFRPKEQQPKPGPTWALKPCLSFPSKSVLEAVADHPDPTLSRALERSLHWHQKPSARDVFPIGPLTHRRAVLSLKVLQEGMRRGVSSDAFVRFLRRNFNCYRPRGDGSKQVLFTGYFSPVYRASLTPTRQCRFPLYQKPPDLAVDPATGEVLGIPILWGWFGYRPYPTRKQLETGGRLKGLEFVYLCSRIDQYFAHIQGAAKLRLREGGTMLVRYGASNGRAYVSVGRRLKERENPDVKLTLQGIRTYFRRHPQKMDSYIRMNPRFIFFQEAERAPWPTGSIGVKLTPLRSLATASHLFPPGAAVLVSTRMAEREGGFRHVSRLMFNQDSGGAFQSMGKADLYFGRGPVAGQRAGRQSSRGRMMFFFLKASRVDPWEARLRDRNLNDAWSGMADAPQGSTNSH